MQKNNEGLNIYLITLDQKDARHYADNFYTGFVVCCKSSDDARKIHPSGRYTIDEKEWKYIVTEKEKKSTMYCPKNNQWVEPNEISNLNVRYIGKASEDCFEGEFISTQYNGC